MHKSYSKEKIIYPILYNTLSFLGSIQKRVVRKKEFFIISYHRIINKGKEFKFYEDIINTDLDDFNKQIEYLVNNFHIISFNELYDVIWENKNLEENLLIITFDDGYKDFYNNVIPILNKHDVKATLFLTSHFASNITLGWWEKIAYMIKTTEKEYIDLPNINMRFNTESNSLDHNVIKIVDKIKYYDGDKKKYVIDEVEKQSEVYVDESELSKTLYLNWGELKKLKKYKVEFGSHSLTHSILTKLNDEQLKSELIDSKKIIEEKLDVNVNTFCYPNGRSRDYNDDIIRMLKESGYLSSVTLQFGSNPLIKNNFDIYSLKRITPINNQYLKKQLNATQLSFLLNRFI